MSFVEDNEGDVVVARRLDDSNARQRSGVITEIKLDEDIAEAFKSCPGKNV